MNIIKNDPYSAPTMARSYMRQCKEALAYIDEYWRAKPAIERYAFARRFAAFYLRQRRKGWRLTHSEWKRERLQFLAKSMRR